jgi:hypothetical protein
MLLMLAGLLSGSIATAHDHGPATPASATLVSTTDHKAQSPEIAIGADDSINMIWIDEDTAPEEGGSRARPFAHGGHQSVFRSFDGRRPHVHGAEGDQRQSR